MARDDEEKLDIVTGLSAERDDGPVTPRAGRPDRAKGDSGGSRNSPRRRAGKSAEKSGGGWLVAVVMLLLVVSGGLGYQLYVVTMQAEKSTQDLELNNKRLAVLENDLNATGLNMEEVGEGFEERFKFWESEVRKLWVIGNEKNKPAIVKNTRNVAAMNTKVTNSVSQISSIVKRQAELDRLMAQLKSDLISDNTALRASQEDQRDQLLVVRSELELLEGRLKDIPPNLTRRVVSNEEAIEAIDAARRQIINNISLLQNRINQLQVNPN